MKYVAYLVLVIGWIAGVVLAKGFGLTLLSIFIPFYAWYLVMEKLMKLSGMI